MFFVLFALFSTSHCQVDTSASLFFYLHLSSLEFYSIVSPSGNYDMVAEFTPQSAHMHAPTASDQVDITLPAFNTTMAYRMGLPVNLVAQSSTASLANVPAIRIGPVWEFAPDVPTLPAEGQETRRFCIEFDISFALVGSSNSLDDGEVEASAVGVTSDDSTIEDGSEEVCVDVTKFGVVDGVLTFPPRTPPGTVKTSNYGAQVSGYIEFEGARGDDGVLVADGQVLQTIDAHPSPFLTAYSVTVESGGAIAFRAQSGSALRQRLSLFRNFSMADDAMFILQASPLGVGSFAFPGAVQLTEPYAGATRAWSMNVTSLGAGLSFANARAEVSADNETIGFLLDVVAVSTSDTPEVMTTPSSVPSTPATPQDGGEDSSRSKNASNGNGLASTIIPVAAVAAGVLVLLVGCCFVGRQRRANAQGPNKYTAEMALGMTPAYSASETLASSDMAAAAAPPPKRSRSGSRRRQSTGAGSGGGNQYGNVSAVAATPAINYETLPPNQTQQATIQYGTLA